MFEFLKPKKKVKAVSIDEPTIESSEQIKRINKLQKEITKGRLDIYERKLEALRQKQEELRLEQEISDLEDEMGQFDEEEEDSESSMTDAGSNPEALLYGIIANAMAKKNSVGTPQSMPTMMPETSLMQTAKTTLTDEQLLEIKKKIPSNYLTQLAKLSDLEVGQAIMQQYPQLDDNTVARAVNVLRS